MDSADLNLFRDSLARVIAQDGFFDSFYDRFIDQSEDIAVVFHHRDMDQLKRKLRSTLEMVSQSAEGEPGITYYLEMLGRTHRRLNVERRHFTMWQTALLDTVAAFDEAYSDRVGAAWSQVIGSVIAAMDSDDDSDHSRKLAS